MRRLVEHRAAALRGVEFFRAARAIEIVGVVERVDHAHRAELAARDQRARARDRRVERMAVADDEMHAARCAPPRSSRRNRRASAPSAFRPAHACRARAASIACAAWILVRRRDVDDLDRRIGAQLLDGLVGLAAENPRQSARRASARGSAAATSATRGSPANVGSITREGAAEARDAEPQLAVSSRSTVSPRQDRGLRSLILDI